MAGEVTHKDINLLSQKATLSGTEKIPVSDTEFTTPNQIAALAGGGQNNIFIATYGTTTHTEISSAITAGKIVFCHRANMKTMYQYISGIDDFPDDLVFTQVYACDVDSILLEWVKVTSGNVWSSGSKTLIDSTKIDTSVSSSSTNTHVPSSKCLYDMVGNIETLLAAL